MKEILDIGVDMDTGPLAGACAQWPDDEHFIAVIGELREAMHATSLKVVEQLLRTLQPDADYLTPFRNDSSFIRLNYCHHSDNSAPADTLWLPIFSRNPYFLAYLLMFAGYTMLLQSPLLLILSLIGFGLIHAMILREERYLAKTHAADYERYRQRVPRYLRLGNWVLPK